MNSYQFNHTLLRASTITFMLINGLFGQAISLGPYEIQPESRLWMEGKSNINEFICDSESLSGYAYFGSENILLPANKFQNVQSNTKLYIFIPIQSFDCGMKKMNNDMYDALIEKQYPVIEFELMESKLIAAPDSAGDWYRVYTNGILTLAGTKKKIEMGIKIRTLSNGKFQITGSIPISMHDFYIDPPTALLGLIKAKPELFVHFDIYANAIRAEE